MSVVGDDCLYVSIAMCFRVVYCGYSIKQCFINPSVLSDVRTRTHKPHFHADIHRVGCDMSGPDAAVAAVHIHRRLTT